MIREKHARAEGGRRFQGEGAITEKEEEEMHAISCKHACLHARHVTALLVSPVYMDICGLCTCQCILILKQHKLVTERRKLAILINTPKINEHVVTNPTDDEYVSSDDSSVFLAFNDNCPDKQSPDSVGLHWLPLPHPPTKTHDATLDAVDGSGATGNRATCTHVSPNVIRLGY